MKLKAHQFLRKSAVFPQWLTESERRIDRDRRQKDRKAERQKDRKTERQADRQTGRQADRQTGRQADRQTDRQTDKDLSSTMRKQT